MLHRLKSIAIACALTLPGCASVETTDSGMGVAPSGTSASYQVAGPSDCGTSIAAFQAVLDSDQKTGNVNQSVYRRAMADMDGVKTACAAGRVADANNRLVAIKARYGYR